MTQLRQIWTRISSFWKRFVLFWPRLIFLLTFFFASADVAFSVVIWVQCPPCKHSWNAGPNRTTTASTASGQIKLPSTATPPTSGIEIPPQDEPAATAQSGAPPAPAATPSFKLIIPVAGIKPNQLRDTFNEMRSEGRIHNAMDIMAPGGAPVLAATEGKIAKLLISDRGGITIYQLSKDEKLVFYYAHLQRYADGLTEGQVAKQGEVIGYVGDTGNAGTGNYHLHFALWSVADPKRYWDGININPYPLLREGQ